jgi:UPF0271 protein
MLTSVDLNCDMGEVTSGNQDAAFMPFISSCSISCAAHAGTWDVIRRTAEAALTHGVAIGAHPSYPDRENLGRGSMAMDAEALMATVCEQLTQLGDHVRTLGGEVSYVKPHGALYNDMYRDHACAALVLDAIVEAGAPKVVYGRSGSSVTDLARERGFRFVHEAFADRRYLPSLELVSRSEPGAVLASEAEVLDQVESLVRDASVTTSDGTPITLSVESICIHSDSPGALDAARAIHAFLRGNDVRIASPA